MTSFLNHQRGAGQHGNEVNDNHRRGRCFWLPWIRQTQENNRTPFHNNTCQIRTGLAHTTTLPEGHKRSIEIYIITQVILAFFLVLAYDLLEDRRMIDVIVTKFFPPSFKMAASFEN